MGRSLVANVWVGGGFFAAGEVPPEEIAAQITNPGAWYEKGDPRRLEEPEPEVESDEPEPDEGYHGLTVAKLKGEIGRRNQGRDEDDMLSKTGSRDDLIAALELDDE